MNTILTEVLKKFLASAGKSVLTAIIAGLGLFLGAPAPTDPAGSILWGGVLLVIRTLISAIGKFIEQWQLAQAAAKNAAKPAA